MIGNFKENCQNLRSALHYRGLLPALWTNVDCNASKVLSPFHLHSCAAEERKKKKKHCKMTATPGVNGEFGKYRWKISLELVSTSWINPFMRVCFLSDENHQLKQQTHKDHLVDFNQLLLPVWCLHIKFLFAIQFSLQTLLQATVPNMRVLVQEYLKYFFIMSDLEYFAVMSTFQANWMKKGAHTL